MLTKSNKLKEIYLFFNTLNKNAPLKSPSSSVKKYPYKPFLILSILQTYKYAIFEEKWLDINNDILIKYFYDYLTNDSTLFDILINQKSKIHWGLGFTNKNKKEIKSLIKEMPLKKLQCDQFLVEKTFFKFKFNIDVENYSEAFDLLKNNCFVVLKKCIPEYNNFSNEEIMDIQEFYISKYLAIGENQKTGRPLQHIFRKNVLDRDKKCLICCDENYVILEACHIKPFTVCEFNEKYDYNNGITLCRNHHKMFDSGIFTFSELLSLEVSDYFPLDDNTYFKQFEKCITNINQNLNIKNYLKYHNQNIFNK